MKGFITSIVNKIKSVNKNFNKRFQSKELSYLDYVKIAAETFRNNPHTNEIFITSDGTAFSTTAQVLKYVMDHNRDVSYGKYGTAHEMTYRTFVRPETVFKQ